MPVKGNISLPFVKKIKMAPVSAIYFECLTFAYSKQTDEEKLTGALFELSVASAINTL